MKLLFSLVLACVLAIGSARASQFYIDGTATWSITKPDCVIEVVGAIRNVSPVNTYSGTLKLALWVSLAPFPSQGANVAEVILAPLQGGAEIMDIREKRQVDLKGFTGNFYFTLVLMEYSGSRWDNRLAVPFGTRKMNNGDFLDDTTWRPTGNTFIAPPASVAVGKRLRLQTKANSVLTRITPGTDADLYINFDADDEVRLRQGTQRGQGIFNYQTARDSFRGKSHRTGRVSIYDNGVRESEVTLFFRTTQKGIYRMTGNGRITWGLFVLR